MVQFIWMKDLADRKLHNWLWLNCACLHQPTEEVYSCEYMQRLKWESEWRQERVHACVLAAEDMHALLWASRTPSNPTIKSQIRLTRGFTLRKHVVSSPFPLEFWKDPHYAVWATHSVYNVKVASQGTLWGVKVSDSMDTACIIKCCELNLLCYLFTTRPCLFVSMHAGHECNASLLAHGAACLSVSLFATHVTGGTMERRTIGHLLSDWQGVGYIPDRLSPFGATGQCQVALSCDRDAKELVATSENLEEVAEVKLKKKKDFNAFQQQYLFIIYIFTQCNCHFVVDNRVKAPAC